MTALHDFVAARGGFARTRDLLAAGASERRLTRAVRSGELLRARNGWYTTRPADDPAVRAVRVGGRLTGLSALAELGVWRWSGPVIIDVAVRRSDARLRSQLDRSIRWAPGSDPQLRISWEHPDRVAGGTPWRVSFVDALVRVVLDEPFADAVIALDWAWRSGHLDRLDFETVIVALPAGLRFIREWVDPESRSILESTARIRLRLAGHEVTSAVPVGPGGHCIDLVVDGVVALETDGQSFHAESFESDRRKDALIAVAGFHGLRASYSMVRDEWPLVARAVGSAVAARRGVPPASSRSASGTAHAPRPPAGNSGTRTASARRHRRARRRGPPAS